MLILFAVLFGGILTGRLLRRRPLRALGSVITFIIWLLLFMLGTEVGGNEEVMRSLATLGVQALVLCTGALAGSIACAWLLWRSIGATTFDTTLPILTRVAGPQYAVVAIFHGCVTDFSVPFLVTFFCSI